MAKFSQSLKSLLLLSLTAALLACSFLIWQMQIDIHQHNKELREEAQQQKALNQGLQERNLAVQEEVDLLRSPKSMVLHEEKAREHYGLIRQGEIFFQMEHHYLKDIPDVPNLEALLAEERKHLIIPVDLKAQENWRP